MTRIHVVSLPHTLITRDYDWCAYTAKTRRFVDMLARTEHQVLVYGPEIHECDSADEYVPVVHEDDRLDWFGRREWDINTVFNRWDSADECWVTMNRRAAEEIRRRWQPGDVLGLIAGLCQQQLVDQLVDVAPTVVEWGIGYSGVLDTSHKVFESYAWMHHVAGLRHKDDIAFFDAVVPNCFDPEDFLVTEKPGDYLLYLGRPNPRKGLPVIAEIARRTDLPVVIAGQPGEPIPGTEYVGVVLGLEKAQLLAGARALLTPTTYLEPFGGVAVEAMMSGTPVISTDWGAFTETVVPGVTGYRCRTLGDFMEAVDLVGDIDRGAVYAHAVTHYSTGVGARMYDRYLRRIETLRTDGWYHIPAEVASHSGFRPPR